MSGCLDAGSAVVWRDDSQIVRLDARKRIARLDEQPGVWIRVAADTQFRQDGAA